MYDRYPLRRRALASLCALIGALLLVASAACDSRPASEPRTTTVTAADGAVAQVRRAYLGRDFWACARDGAALRLVHPDSAPLQSWTILCVARAKADAVPLAEAMLRERPGEPWALFARAGALVDHPRRGAEEGIPAARAALAAMPDHPDAVWLLARALVVHAPREEAEAFFAAQPQPAPADLVALELAFVAQQFETTESRIAELADRVRALDPDNVDAEFMTATWQLLHRRPGEAEASLRRALALSPHAPPLHARLWQAIDVSPTREAADRRAAIDADVALLLQHRGDSPAALQAAAHVYQDMSQETYQELTAEVLTRFPDSAEADWARYGQLLALDMARDGRKGPADPAADAEELRLLDAFLARPVVTRLLGDVTRMRYWLLRDIEGVAPEALRDALQAWAQHDRNNFQALAVVAVELSERTAYDAEAEAIARLALERGEARLAEARRTDPAAATRDPGFLLTPLYGALAATLQAQGRDAEAREVLERGRPLESRAAKYLVQLAALAEADGRLDEAEQLLVEGLPRWGGDATCDDALRQLYRRRHGNERGYAAHRERLEAEHHERRRTALLAKSTVEPEALRPFALPKLGGGERASDSLRGKLAVIHFWGRSCGACVMEMPALQQFADAVAGSPDVVFTTVHTDDDTAELTEWLAERQLRLEVLLGARYYLDSGWRSIPLTLFVAPDGRVAFVHEGASARLVEEFGWYVEATRERATRDAVASLRAAG
ncbi:redoxin domain-containing protein [Nannocystis pusilla]|uniref:Redoxin domain-containing protein n=1 Tax=Nannocystis pusilla TaxID=889268 RepID=A0ABS7U316_9BACT|nr:redoxin domain-containing protein [Nannocystis pusilla]MBZ5714930.1 redoxin domain-containing protein [Nannocystis pusilla]